MEKNYKGIEADSSPPFRKGSSQLLDKPTRRYDMVKLLSIFQHNNTPSIRIKELSSLAEKDGMTGEELLKKLENGEWHVLCKKEEIEN